MKRNGETHFPRLESELILRRIPKKELQSCIGCKAGTFTLKLNGGLRFSLDEAIQIQQTFFPDIPIEELFRHEPKGNQS